MTIKIPEPDVADKILSWIGKRRAIGIPLEAYEKFGAYVYAQAEKESFWRALARPKNRKPPEGWEYAKEILSDEIPTRR